MSIYEIAFSASKLNVRYKRHHQCMYQSKHSNWTTNPTFSVSNFWNVLSHSILCLHSNRLLYIFLFGFYRFVGTEINGNLERHKKEYSERVK